MVEVRNFEDLKSMLIPSVIYKKTFIITEVYYKTGTGVNEIEKITFEQIDVADRTPIMDKLNELTNK